MHAHRSYPIDDAIMWEILVAFYVSDDVITAAMLEARQGGFEKFVELAKAKIVIRHVMDKISKMMGEELSDDEKEQLRRLREKLQNDDSTAE